MGELHAGSATISLSARHRVLRSQSYLTSFSTDKTDRIYIAPHADDLPSWVASMQHIAKEGRCFVISANQFCRVSDFPTDYPPFTPESHDRQLDGSRWTPDAILNHGGSCVVGPLGTFVTEPVWDEERIVYADLQMHELVEARMDFDVVGSYARPDIL